MQNAYTHNILKKIISLTTERDLISLEYLLAKSLYDLILPADVDIANAVKIYHAKNLTQQIFTTTDTKRNPDGEQLSQHLKDQLSHCFTKCENSIVNESNKPSVTLYPLKNSLGKAIAVIAIQTVIEDADLSKTIGLVLQIYQNFSGIIRDNEHDTLTGLLNRKTFEYKVNKMLSMMHKKKMRQDDKPNSAYFLAILDIDHFKKINDVHGHLVGDKILVEFTKLMKETFREKDMLFRYGGEEFVAIFECANASDIKPVLERFRMKVADYHFPNVKDVKASIGFTQIKQSDATLQIVDRADQALYHAKENGRNQICHFEAMTYDTQTSNTVEANHSEQNEGVLVAE